MIIICGQWREMSIMDKIIKLEIKRTFKIKKILILLFSLLVGISSGIIFLNGVEADKVSPDGKINIIKGSEAIELLKEYNKKSSGYITEEKLISARNIYNSSYDRKKDKMVITKEFLEVESLYGTMESLGFPTDDNMIIVPWNDRVVPVEYAENFYGLRQNMIKKYINSINDKDVSKKIMDMENKIKKPFYIGTNINVWGDSLEWMSVLIGLNMFIAMIFASSVFTDLKENGLYDIVSKTNFGYKKLGISKVISTTIFNTILYAASVFAYFMIIYSALGRDGLLSSFQVDMAFSPGNLLFKDAVLFQVVGGYIGILSVTALSMLVSACLEKTKHSLITMVSCYALYELFYIFIRPSSRIIRCLMDFSPFGISQVFYKLPFYNFINVGVVVWLPIAMCVFGMIQWIIYNALVIYKTRK